MVHLTKLCLCNDPYPLLVLTHNKFNSWPCTSHREVIAHEQVIVMLTYCYIMVGIAYVTYDNNVCYSS